ncbi:hypothetical protein AWC38_SpisGene2820 [Stylophora pistillata]|uniref:Uncharacterized protein n=1 Tax=Stylophora pistillata TaxID=50429 RepID=A0A2B4SV54_STYPI|nr:hypothetical protein AWC38_SpisGene2820 [Stylophora pistillata]
MLFLLHVYFISHITFERKPHKTTGSDCLLRLNNNHPFGVLRRRERFTALQILRDKMKSLSALVLPLLFLTLVTIPLPSLQSPVPRESAGKPCVRQTHMRNGFLVTECESASFGCLRSIPTYGYPKCQPVYQMMEIPQPGENNTVTSHLRGKQATIVDCKCAS